jgi:type VI secretion system protein ImpH
MSGGILSELKEGAFRYDFFHALRRIENEHKKHSKIGSDCGNLELPIRFGQKPSLEFPASTLQSLEESTDGRPPLLNQSFFGLFGSNGPLPIHITEHAHDRMFNASDKTLVDFLNIFHNRFIALFYRAWAVSNKAVDYDRPEEAQFPKFIASFIGCYNDNPSDIISQKAKCFYMPEMISEARSQESLEIILSKYFKLNAIIEPCTRRTIPVPAEYMTSLGKKSENGILGAGAFLGSTWQDIQNNFRVILGPISLERLKELLPTGASFRALKEWISFYTSNRLNWDVQLILEAGEVPSTQLGSGSQLGWTSWLLSEPVDVDATDLVLSP